MDSDVILDAKIRLFKEESGKKRKGSEQGNHGGGICWHRLLFEPGPLRSHPTLLIRFVVLPGRRQLPAKSL